ncbi:MAG: hypothetical protein LVR00_01420 [Rhabdochlamydiaceae bacterium]
MLFKLYAQETIPPTALDTIHPDLLSWICKVANIKEEDLRKNPHLLRILVNDQGESPLELWIRKSEEDSPITIEDGEDNFKVNEEAFLSTQSTFFTQYEKLVKAFPYDKMTDETWEILKSDEKLAYEVAKAHISEIDRLSHVENDFRISDYNIKDPELLRDIGVRLSLSKKSDPVGVVLSFKSSKDRAETVKRMAQEGRVKPSTLEKCKIEDPKDRAEIAKILAAKDGVTVSIFISRYGVSDPTALEQIAEIAVTNNPLAFLYIQNYRLPSEAHIRISQNLVHHVASTQFLRKIVRCEIQDLELKKYLHLAHAIYLMSKDDINDEIVEFLKSENIEIERSLFEKNDIFKAFIESAFAYKKEKFSKADQQIFDKIVAYRNRNIAASLLFVFGTSFVEISENKRLYLSLTKDAVHLILPMLILVKWGNKDSELTGIKRKLSPLRDTFRDKQKPLLQDLLQTLLTLDAEDREFYLDKSRRLALIDECASYLTSGKEAEEMSKRLRIVEALCSSNSFEILKNPFTQNMTEVLTNFLPKNMIDFFPGLKKIDQFEKKYMNLIDQMRIPLAFQIYGSSIKKNSDHKLEAEFQQFLKSIFEGSYKHDRYDTKHNPHLELISSSAPNIFQAWKNGTDLEGNLLKPIDIENGLTVCLTDDWQDLFLCGTEVVGSCQRIDESIYNKCLLAYPMDGKIQMIAIKDPSGKVVARCILRILVDETTQKPVLFQSRDYDEDSVRVSSMNVKKIMIDYGKTIAEAINCPLTTKDPDEQLPDYPHGLESLGSASSWEYVDDLEEGGLVKQGEYILRGVKVY